MRTALLVFIVACASAGFGRQGPRCDVEVGDPPAAILSPQSLVGSYDLEWLPAPPWPSTVRRERLWLWRTSSSDSSTKRGLIRAAPGDTLIYPLFGTVLPQRSRVSGGDSLRRATDAIFPPVLLYGDWPHDSSGMTRLGLVLLVGTITNRQPDVMSHDGGGVGVRLDRVGPHGFGGKYRAWGIIPTDSGYLCARKVS